MRISKRERARARMEEGRWRWVEVDGGWRVEEGRWRVEGGEGWEVRARRQVWLTWHARSHSRQVPAKLTPVTDTPRLYCVPLCQIRHIFSTRIWAFRIIMHKVIHKFQPPLQHSQLWSLPRVSVSQSTSVQRRQEAGSGAAVFVCDLCVQDWTQHHGYDTFYFYHTHTHTHWSSLVEYWTDQLGERERERERLITYDITNSLPLPNTACSDINIPIDNLIINCPFTPHFAHTH